MFPITSQSKRSDLLAEADHRLSNQINTNFSVIAWELQHVDQYQYIRAFSAGLQEFIEAYTYFNYVRDESIVSCSNLQLRLTYQQGVNKKNDKAVELPVPPPFTCLIDQTEFLLGIGDLTGEVMRRSIFALGIGDFETCFAACRFLRSVYSWYVLPMDTHENKIGSLIYNYISFHPQLHWHTNAGQTTELETGDVAAKLAKGRNGLLQHQSARTRGDPDEFGSVRTNGDGRGLLEQLKPDRGATRDVPKEW